MSEALNPKELPHEFLLKRHKLEIGNLSKHTQQLKSDLDKTLQFSIRKSKDGMVHLTPATQQKISTYDRYICDGIFEYLEDQDKISENQAQAEEVKMEEKREEVETKMEEAHEEALEEKEKDVAEDEAQPKDQAEVKEEVKEEKKDESWADFFGI